MRNKIKTKGLNKIHGTLCFLFGIGLMLNISCKKDEKNSTEYYIKNLTEIADKYNAACPKKQSNGATLESVSFEDSVLLYRVSVSAGALNKINIDNVKDSLIKNVSENLKTFLVKGKCNLEYRYIAPKDSASIIIESTELADERMKEKENK